MTVEQWLGEDNELGINIWKNKYRYGDETFEEWLDRVSGGDSAISELIRSKKFLFGGRILSNRGLEKTGKKLSLSNCYVISPVEDNLESIFDCAKNLARTYSYGGGCGLDLSNLSPRGARINNASKETSGAVSFMDLYSLTTELIGQEGRRGALMLSLSCDHPDLEEFIQLKSNLDKVNKANISVRVTDEFMRAVENKQLYKLRYERKETGEVIEKEVDAYAIFKKLCTMNWDYAEPGILFWDKIESYNMLSGDKEFRYAGVNPCGEEPLPAGGSCLLGSINLAEFVMPNGRFDFSGFEETVCIAVRGLNDVLDEGLPLHPLKEQKDSVRDYRQIGLGIMGLADMLIKMEIRYGSQQAIHLCDKIGFAMADNAIWSSSNLSIEHDTYPKFNELVLETDFIKRNTDVLTKNMINEHGLRNSQILTIAPTGTLSTMLGISGGIEPIFATHYTRKTESLHSQDKYYKVYTPIVKEYIEQHNLTDEPQLPKWFVTSQTLDFNERIEMQGVWQDHIDASISSTVNVPNDFTIEQTEELYMKAWKRGLKGITIFRDGCSRVGVLTTNDDTKEEVIDEKTLARGEIVKLDDTCVGKKRSLMTGCGTLHCEAFFDKEGRLVETYLSKGSTGGCNNFMIGLSRLISLSSRGGIGIHDVIDQLKSCGVCPSYAVRAATKRDTSKGSCCPVAIGKALLEMHNEFQQELESKSNTKEKNESSKEKAKSKKQKAVCPTCNEKLVFESGCNSCKSCGWSKCD